MATRQDIDRKSGLTAEQLRSYRSDGFVTICGVLTPDEPAELRGEADRLWEQRALFETGNLRTCARRTLDGGLMLDRLDPVNNLSPIFTRFSVDPRLTGLARSAIGEDVRLLKDKIIYKPPGALGYDLHQDLPYIPLELRGDAIAIVMISIDPADEVSGPVEFFPNLHHDILSGLENNSRDVNDLVAGLDHGRMGLTEAGDVIMFHSLTPHRTRPMFRPIAAPSCISHMWRPVAATLPGNITIAGLPKCASWRRRRARRNRISARVASAPYQAAK